MSATSFPQEAGHDAGLDTLTGRADAEFRRLLEVLPAGAYTCDTAGMITYYNPPAVRVWGRTPKLNDPSDRYCGSYRLFSPQGESIPHEQCWMGRALSQNRAYNGYEIVVERPDGTRRLVLAYADPIRGQRGEVVGGLNVLVDVTDQKRMEEELRHVETSKNEVLVKGVDELRNALAPIRNAVHLLHMQSGSSPEPQWALGIMDRQIRHLAMVVDKLEEAVSAERRPKA